MSSSVPDSFPLKGTNIRIPSRGLGTFQPDPELYPDGSVKASVLHALKVGYRHIDTALAYTWGAVEREVGEAIRESGVPREELFIVTKLQNCFHAPEDVQVGMDMSLKNLGLDYVDLYLMHFPFAYAKEDDYSTLKKPDGRPVVDIPLSRAYDKTYQAMEKLVDQGKTKFIGVSNFPILKLKRLLSICRIHPIVNQVELHPHFPQKQLLRFCNDHGIHITAYGPLGCVPADPLIGREGPGPLEDLTILALAAKYSRTPAQIILSYLIDSGVSVIPKSNSLSRISENFDCLSKLKAEDQKALSELMGPDGERGVRNLQPRDFLGFDNYNEEVEEP